MRQDSIDNRAMPPICDSPYAVLYSHSGFSHVFGPTLVLSDSHFPSQAWEDHHFHRNQPFFGVENHHHVRQTYNFHVNKVTEKNDKKRMAWCLVFQVGGTSSWGSWGSWMPPLHWGNWQVSWADSSHELCWFCADVILLWCCSVHLSFVGKFPSQAGGDWLLG